MPQTMESLLVLRERIRNRLHEIEQNPSNSLGVYDELRLTLVFVADTLTHLEEMEGDATYACCV